MDSQSAVFTFTHQVFWTHGGLTDYHSVWQISRDLSSLSNNALLWVRRLILHLLNMGSHIATRLERVKRSQATNHPQACYILPCSTARRHVKMPDWSILVLFCSSGRNLSSPLRRANSQSCTSIHPYHNTLQVYSTRSADSCTVNQFGWLCEYSSFIW